MRAAVAAVLLAAGCSPEAPPPPPAPGYAPGGLYTVTDGRSFKVVKILAADDRAVHVRLYKNSWSSRPRQVDPVALVIGAVTDPDGFGAAHLPLDRQTFAGWDPVFLAPSTLSPQELEGYSEWKARQGGASR